MGLLDFVREAGERVFGAGSSKQDDLAKATALNKLAGDMNLAPSTGSIVFEKGVATITGSVPSQAHREKLILLVGNVQGVAQVNDQLQVEKPEPEATLYTVKSGDTLSAIAKRHYGDAMKYPLIFEANEPMLKDPNKIYPGQVLRIPPA